MIRNLIVGKAVAFLTICFLSGAMATEAEPADKPTLLPNLAKIERGRVCQVSEDITSCVLEIDLTEAQEIMVKKVGSREKAEAVGFYAAQPIASIVFGKDDAGDSVVLGLSRVIATKEGQVLISYLLRDADGQYSYGNQKDWYSLFDEAPEVQAIAAKKLPAFKEEQMKKFVNSELVKAESLEQVAEELDAGVSSGFFKKSKVYKEVRKLFEGVVDGDEKSTDELIRNLVTSLEVQADQIATRAINAKVAIDNMVETELTAEAYEEYFEENAIALELKDRTAGEALNDLISNELQLLGHNIGPMYKYDLEIPSDIGTWKTVAVEGLGLLRAKAVQEATAAVLQAVQLRVAEIQNPSVVRQVQTPDEIKSKLEKQGVIVLRTEDLIEVQEAMVRALVELEAQFYPSQIESE